MSVPLIQRTSDKARQSINQATALVSQMGAEEVDPDHLLVGMLDIEVTVAHRLLQKMGVVPGELSDAVKGRMAPAQEAAGFVPRLSTRSDAIMERAWSEATGLGDHYIGTEHLLLAFAQDHSLTRDHLSARGVTTEQIREWVRALHDPA